MTAYHVLEKRFGRLGALQEASGVLQWDSAVLMPEGGAAARAEQLATVKVVCHEILTDAAMGDLLDGASAQNDLDDWQRANLREMRRAWLHATAVPGDLVDAASRAASACEQVWPACSAISRHFCPVSSPRRSIARRRRRRRASRAAHSRSSSSALAGSG